MTKRCPNCYFPLESVDPAEVTVVAERIRTECRTRGLHIRADDSVREKDGAVLMGLAHSTVRNRRYGEGGLPVFRDSSGHVRCRIEDLAAHMIAESRGC